MPIAYKVVYFFESEQQAMVGAGSALGWTETFYWQPQQATTLEQAIMDPSHDEWMKRRLAFMSEIYRLSFIRVSQDDNPRRFKIRGVTNRRGLVPTSAINGLNGGPAAQVQCAILADLEKLPAADNDTSHHRRYLLRGLPAEIISGNVINGLSQYYDTLLNFLRYIAGHEAGVAPVPGAPRYPWGIRYHDPGITASKIINLQIAPYDSGIVLTTENPPIVGVVGQHYQISGVPSPLGVNKTWKFAGTFSIAPTTFNAWEKSRKQLQGTYTGPGPGKIRRVGSLYGPPDQFVVIGLRNKRTGRVFRQLRGRSRGA